jgi:bifunctional non-homologous end joining protein LigD
LNDFNNQSFPEQLVEGAHEPNFQLPKRLQPMLATLTNAPFDDAEWVFEDKYDGFRMVAKIVSGKVTLYSRNGKTISHSYGEVAKALQE